MKNLLSIFLLLSIGFTSISYAQEKNWDDFTKAGDKVNCLTAKFLLEDDESPKKRLLELNCNDCVFDYGSVGASRDLKDAVEGTKYKDNIKVAKSIEFKKRRERDKYFLIAGTDDSLDKSRKLPDSVFVQYIRDLIQFSTIKVGELRGQAEAKELKSKLEVQFDEVLRQTSGGGGEAGNGEAGNGEAGNGEAGNGEAGNGEAGNGEAGNGEAGNGEAGNGEAGNGEAGNGEAGNGEAGNGEAGNGEAGNGEAGNDEAGGGDDGGGEAGNGDDGNGEADNGEADNGNNPKPKTAPAGLWAVAIASLILAIAALVLSVLNRFGSKKKTSYTTNFKDQPGSMNDNDLGKHVESLKKQHIDNPEFPRELVESVFNNHTHVSDWIKRIKEKEYSVDEMQGDNAREFSNELIVNTLENIRKRDYHPASELESLAKQSLSVKGLRESIGLKGLEESDVQATVDRHVNNLIESFSDVNFIKKAKWENELKTTNQLVTKDLEKQLKDISGHSPPPSEGITEKTTAKKYYLPFPDKDGFFWDKDLSEQIHPVYSAYEVSLMPNNPDKAQFWFLTESKKVNPAIQNFDVNLEPVCEIVKYDESGTKIQQVGEPGEIHLDGDKWRVVPGKKLKIEIV